MAQDAACKLSSLQQIAGSYGPAGGYAVLAANLSMAMEYALGVA